MKLSQYGAVTAFALVLVLTLSFSAFAQQNATGQGSDSSTTQSSSENPPQKMMFGQGHMGSGHMKELSEEEKAEMEARRSAIDAAIEAGDYQAWYELVKETPFGEKLTEKITAENFSRFAEAHALRKSAHEQMEKAREIMEELGITHEGMGTSGHKGPGHVMMMKSF